MKTITTVMGGLVMSAAIVAAGGCANEGLITSETFRKNPSPELYSYTASKEQYKNDRAEVVDQNMRQIPDDINYLLLLDRPMHLTPYAMP